MSMFSKATGRDRKKAKERARVASQQNAPGGVLNFQKQIDAAGTAATGRGTTAETEYLNRAMTFDPTAAIQKYASAQWDTAINDPSMGLKRQLSDLGGRSVSAGRLDTGFYDEDQGAIMQNVMRGYGNQVASTALDATRMNMENTENLGGYGERQSQLGLDVAGARYGELQTKAEEKAARARSKKRGVGRAIGGLLGAGVGFATGGWQGAKTGWDFGSNVGGGF